MSKITVTTIAGATSGADANKVKIESGDTLEVTSNATVGGTLGVTGNVSTNGQLGLNTSGTGVAGRFGTGITVRRAVPEVHLRRDDGNGEGGILLDNNSSTQRMFVGTYNANQETHIGTNGTQRLIINNSGHITMPNQPVFYAAADSTIALTSGGFAEITSFSSAHVNVGSHYNTSNGRFTAPTAGTYQFAVASIGNQNADVYRFRFYKNGSSLYNYELRIQTEGGAYAINGEMNITATLAASDYISIFARSDGGNNAYADSSFRYTYFRGHLMG